MPVNEMDKCTIVSVFPKEIRQNSPTIFPGQFVIPAAEKDKFSLLVVGPSSWWKEMEEGQPYLEIPTSSVNMAKSIINDFSNGLLGFDPDKAPGLFYVQGEWQKENISKYVERPTGKAFIDLLNAAREKQKRWFAEIVQIADVMWARTNGNPLSVDDNARMAAEMLGLKDKLWLKDTRMMEMTSCKACGHLVNPGFPVCSNCKAIVDPVRAKELGLQFAS